MLAHDSRDQKIQYDRDGRWNALPCTSSDTDLVIDDLFERMTLVEQAEELDDVCVLVFFMRNSLSVSLLRGGYTAITDRCAVLVASSVETEDDDPWLESCRAGGHCRRAKVLGTQGRAGTPPGT